ncbi:MAG TPA: hypothetical protein O0X21_02740 [Methanocorpusculum sp.]|jgi:hypothetical protein|nr:hypothetical protein [Methanocorpusculum sp.]
MPSYNPNDVSYAVSLCGLSDAEAKELLEQVNKTDENVSLDSLFKYADFMVKNEPPRIDSCEIPAGRLWYIEPFCGSTTYVIEIEDRLVLVDSGFPCYAEQLLATLRSIFPDYDERKKGSDFNSYGYGPRRSLVRFRKHLDEQNII